MSRLAWVTGAGGLIGSYIVRAAARFAPDWQVRGLQRPDLDLCDLDVVTRAFRADRPQVVVHCAAISKSPLCQSDPALAWLTNTRVTEHLAELAGDGQMLFFSSDLVFDGRTGQYTEMATAQPLSVYGETKLAAEHAVLQHPRHVVIRTSLQAGASPTGDRSLDEQLRLAWAKGQTTRLFIDEFRSPMHASVTARVVWEIVAQQLSGLFHVAGAERLSRWEIGQLIAARSAHLDPKLESGSLKSYSGSPRAPDTSLDCAKIQATLSFALPRFSEWLKCNPVEAENADA